MIAHNKPSLSQLESEAVNAVMATNHIACGEEVRLFESDFCHLYGLAEGSAVAVSSGSAALYLALMSVNAKNRAVSLPAYSCASLENATLLAGGIPNYVDSQKNSFNINLACNNNSDIVIYPHMFGIPSILSKKVGQIIIEDCAQAIGSSVNNQLVGLQGELGVFSFYATKLMTSAGQGGMVISNNKKLIDFIKDFINFDCKSDAKLRFNFLMTDIQASVARVQLKRLFTEFIPRRETIYQGYLNTGLPFYNNYNSDIKSVKFRALLKTSNPYKIIDFLHKEKIKAIVPVEVEELLGEQEFMPNALFNTQNWVSIPCYPQLRDDECAHIVKTLIKARHLL